MNNEQLDMKNQFLSRNIDLPLRSEHGVSVVFEELPNGRLSLLVRIEYETLKGDIKKSFPFIWEWKKRLIQWQGKDQKDKVIQWLRAINDAQKNGATYKEISWVLNNIINKDLIRFFRYSKELEKASKKFKTINDFDEWLYKNHNPDEEGSQFWNTENILEALNYSEEERQEIIQGLIDDYKNDPELLTKVYPISDEELKHRIKYERKTHLDIKPIVNLFDETGFSLPVETDHYNDFSRGYRSKLRQMYLMAWNEAWVDKPFFLRNLWKEIITDNS